MKYSKNSIIRFDLSSCFTLVSGVLWITGVFEKDLIFYAGDKIDFRALQAKRKRRIIGQVLEDCELLAVEDILYEKSYHKVKVREIGTAPLQN